MRPLLRMRNTVNLVKVFMSRARQTMPVCRWFNAGAPATRTQRSAMRGARERPSHVPRGFTRLVATAVSGSSGQ